jgi:hydroxypyruvate reductase
LSLDSLDKLRNDARAIFDAGLKAVEATSATLRFIDVRDKTISIGETPIDPNRPIYSVSIGKAALGMAQALDQRLGKRLKASICVCPEQTTGHLADHWQLFRGGHPLPNEESLRAAQATFQLLDTADAQQATVIFAVSGGGSAMLEFPLTGDISLADLQTANRILVSCGASIAEMNTIRRTFSSVKGGKLLARAPTIRAITLIISDTNEGDESSVASGPTIPPAETGVSAVELVSRYKLETKLPPSILRAINGSSISTRKVTQHPHYVMASNRTALNAAKAKAESIGLRTLILDDVSEQPITEGCERLLSVLKEQQGSVCLLSGGEFSCPLRGDGLGGRNAETALRCAISLDQTQARVVLSAGTDGIDGNSPAAGAIADNRTIRRAESLGLAPGSFLERSDSYSFFAQLGDAIIIGPTGTNVRDIRVVIRADL